MQKKGMENIWVLRLCGHTLTLTLYDSNLRRPWRRSLSSFDLSIQGQMS